KRLDNGDRDTVRLYSYSARFTRKLETLADPVALTDSLRAWTPAVKRGKAQGLPEAFIVGLADFQLGKSERGRGTAHTVEQIQKGMQGAVEQVERIRSQGRNLR